MTNHQTEHNILVVAINVIISQIPVKVTCNLFDTLVKPILTYNSEISFMDSYLKLFRATLRAEKSNSEIDELNFIDKTATEKVHLGFC